MCGLCTAEATGENPTKHLMATERASHHKSQEQLQDDHVPGLRAQLIIPSILWFYSVAAKIPIGGCQRL